ncbi:MAG: hypothetical protein KH260_07545 [Lachnospiraceae bacterium oral taxon 082]|nr:hypothetical protein [Lachnospiraceae bacterium oral taxon 082]
MKKNIFIPLLFLTVVMTACSNGAKSETTASTTAAAETTTVATATTEAPTTAETTTQAAVIEEESHAEDDIQFYRGKKENNVYTNSVFNIKFDAPANGYKMQSRDNIAQMRDIFIKQSGMSQEEADSSIYMDVYATSENGKGVSSVNVVIEKMGTPFENETELAKVVDNLQNQYKAAGMVNVSVESDKARFNGKETIALNATDTSGDYTVYRKQIYIKSGNFMAIITASSTSEEKAQKALDGFTSLN